MLDYGPLQNLIGVWKGDKGTDIAPKPDEDENNPYYETLTFSPVDIDIENAEKQQLMAVRYHQVVREKANDKVSHDETGYWIWNKLDNSITLTFSIPRGVTVLANGQFIKHSADHIDFQVFTKEKDIAQSDFMSKNAKTTSFKREINLEGNTLAYSQETIVDIYSKKSFSHTDENTLLRV